MKATSVDKSFVSSLQDGKYVQSEPISIPREGIISDGVTAITPYGIYLLKEGLIDYKPIKLTESWLPKFGFILDSTNKFQSHTTFIDRVTKIYFHKNDIQDIKVEVVYNGDETELRRIGIKSSANEFINLLLIDEVHEFQNIFKILTKINLKLC